MPIDAEKKPGLAIAFVALVVGAIALPAVAAPTKPKVAAFDFKGIGGVSPDEIGFLIDRILVRLSATKRYDTISRSDLNAMLGQELIKDKLGCATDGCLADIGGAAGSKYLLTGQVSHEAGQYRVLVSVLDVDERKSIAKEEFIAYGGPSALYEKADEIVSRIFGATAVSQGGPIGDLVVIVNPSASEYRIDSGPWNTYVAGRRNSAVVAPGEHRLEVRANGYKDLQERIFVTAGKVETAQVDLVPELPAAQTGKTGWLSISSEPENGADVYLDGALLDQKTPATIKQVPAGQHHIALKKPLFQPFQIVVDIKPDDIRPVNARLVENFGSAFIDSRPTGATVYVDGVNSGLTPLKIDRLEAKAHRIKLSMALFHDVDDLIIVPAVKGYSNTFTLPPAFGTLIVDADKDDAKVLLDGQVLGAAPVTKTPIPAGRVFVKVQKDLHRSFEQYIDIVDGQTARVRAKLIEEYGTLTVASTPRGAKVFLDDREIGLTPIKKDIGVGSYRVRVDAGPQHHPAAKLVQIQVGKPITLDETLQPRLGNVLIAANAPDAAVFVDGRRLGTAPLKLEKIFAGEHKLRIEAPSFEAQERTVTVVESRTVELDVSLRKLMPEELKTQVLADWRARRSKYVIAGALQLTSAAVVSVIGGIVFYAASRDKLGADGINQQYQAAVTPEDAVRLREQYEARLATANRGALAAEIMWGIAGAALVSGIVTLALMPREPETRVMNELSVSVLPAANGLNASARWSLRW